MQSIKQSSLCLTLIASMLCLGSTGVSAASKKTVTKTTTTTTSTVTIPAPCPPPLTLKDGFYLGIKGFYDSYAIRVNPRISNPAGTGLGIAATNPTMANGWGGGIFGGYGLYFFNNMFYAGGEIFINDTSAFESNSFTISDPDSIAGVNGNVSAAVSWGISFIPGYRVSDASLFFLRLGYEQAQLKGAQNFGTSLGGGLFSSGYVKGWEGGFNYGLGLETAITENMSVRIEGDYMHNNRFNDRISVYKPSDNQYSVGLNYHFD